MSSDQLVRVDVPDAAAPSEAPTWRSFLRWETGLFFLLICVVLYGVQASPYFLSWTTFFFMGLNMGEIAIMALPLTLIVITGEIDLSVAAMLGLASTLLGDLYLHHWPLLWAMVTVLIVGAVGGALNGYLITRVGLPSIAVTIGTLTLFRGIAEILLGSASVGNYPPSWTNIGVLPIPHTQIAYSFGIFLVLAAVCALVLQGTPVGRSIYALGLQPEAARFSGIRVNRIKFMLFVLSGVVCAFAGILWTFRFATSRYDAGTGLELTVVTIVLLAGVSIFGGRGTILGVLLSVLIVGCLQQVLTAKQVDAQVQNIVTGVLLLISVIVPNSGEAIRRLRSRAKRHP